MLLYNHGAYAPDSGITGGVGVNSSTLLLMLEYHKDEPFLLVADAEFGEEGEQENPSASFWTVFDSAPSTWYNEYVKVTPSLSNPNSCSDVMAWMVDNSEESRACLLEELSIDTMHNADELLILVKANMLRSPPCGSRHVYSTKENFEATISEFPFCCGIGFIENGCSQVSLLKTIDQVQEAEYIDLYEPVTPQDYPYVEPVDVQWAFVVAMVDVVDANAAQCACWKSRPLNGKVLLAVETACEAATLWD